jgi:hypothetical protein
LFNWGITDQLYFSEHVDLFNECLVQNWTVVKSYIICYCHIDFPIKDKFYLDRSIPIYTLGLTKFRGLLSLITYFSMKIIWMSGNLTNYISFTTLLILLSFVLIVGKGSWLSFNTFWINKAFTCWVCLCKGWTGFWILDVFWK